MQPDPFVLFGPSHLATLVLVCAAATALPLWARQTPERGRTVGAVLAVLLIAHEIVKVVVRVGVYGYPLERNLPLHLCGITLFLGAAMLLTRSRRLWELVYFWGFGGTLQALITPDVDYDFPHPVYWLFMISHGMVLVLGVYGAAVFGFRPTWRTVLRVWLALNLYALAVTPINLWLDANYLYLRFKPHHASLMDHFGPWPWYILVLEALAFLSFCLWMLPFAILDRLESRRGAGSVTAPAETADTIPAQGASKSANQSTREVPSSRSTR